MELTLGTVICMLQDNPHLKFVNNDNEVLSYNIQSEYLELRIANGLKIDNIWRLNFNDKWTLAREV
jgi:hypothetical protein